MQTNVETEAGKKHTATWEPYPLLVALGEGWTWNSGASCVDLKHASGLWTRGGDVVYTEDETEVALIAGALLAAVAGDPGMTGHVTVSMRRDEVEGGDKLSSWVEQAEDPRQVGPVFELFVPAAPKVEDVSDWTDEQLLEKFAELMTAAEVIATMGSEPADMKAKVAMARGVEIALASRGYAWDESSKGWVGEKEAAMIADALESAITGPTA